jgi:murein DD-endopeptidase MepM/ murein hydrolase activator NlpD
MLKLCYPLNLPFNISQKFGENHDYYFTNFGYQGHNGWDFACPIGTPIYATHDGTVFFVGEMADMAKQISIDTPNKDFRTFYAHLSEFKVTPGQQVKRGDLIGLSGNTGRFTTGPHLHFGLHPMKDYLPLDPKNGFGGAIDPTMYFDGSYPSSPAPVSIPATIDPSKFLAMQQTILDFQVSEGITDFVGKPLSSVKYGPQTLKKASKYMT